MRAVIQRVTEAGVIIDNKEKREIKKGLVVLLGIEDTDRNDDIIWLTGKIIRLRIFDHIESLINLSVQEIGGDILLISQFTLHASTRKGNRPSYIKAAKPEIAIPLYETFIKQMQSELGKTIQTGEFGAYMKVSLINDGPVTIIIDTKNKEI